MLVFFFKYILIFVWSTLNLKKKNSFNDDYYYPLVKEDCAALEIVNLADTLL